MNLHDHDNSVLNLTSSWLCSLETKIFWLILSAASSNSIKVLSSILSLRWGHCIARWYKTHLLVQYQSVSDACCLQIIILFCWYSVCPSVVLWWYLADDNDTNAIKIWNNQQNNRVLCPVINFLTAETLFTFLCSSHFWRVTLIWCCLSGKELLNCIHKKLDDCTEWHWYIFLFFCPSPLRNLDKS